MPKHLTHPERQVIDREIEALQLRLEDATALDTAPERKDHTTVLVVAVIVIASLGVASVLSLVILKPKEDNTASIATIVGFLVPLMTALLAAAVQQVHLAVNSRLSQLLRVTASKSRAEGVLAEKKDNPPHVEEATETRQETVESGGGEKLSHEDAKLLSQTVKSSLSRMPKGK